MSDTIKQQTQQIEIITADYLRVEKELASVKKLNTDLIDQIEQQKDEILRKDNEYSELKDEIDKIENQINQQIMEMNQKMIKERADARIKETTLQTQISTLKAELSEMDQKRIKNQGDKERLQERLSIVESELQLVNEKYTKLKDTVFQTAGFKE